MPAAEITHLAGAPVATPMPTESGRPHDIFRCPTCGTALWSDYGRRRVLLFVRVGTLDDPTSRPPDVHIYTRSKLPWLSLPPQIPAFPEYYDRTILWPAASLARLKALVKAP